MRKAIEIFPKYQNHPDVQEQLEIFEETHKKWVNAKDEDEEGCWENKTETAILKVAKEIWIASSE